MNRIKLPAIFVLMIAFLLGTISWNELELGKKAPKVDVKLQDLSGNMRSLSELKKENGLVVMFSSNTCPWVKAWEGRFNELATLAAENNIGFVALNPNEAGRDQGESLEDMRQRATEKEYAFPYLYDENAELALAFGATKTPHVFFLDGNMKLIYRGAIDDNAQDVSAVKNPWLKDAIKAVGSGLVISRKTSKALGCSIKFPDGI